MALTFIQPSGINSTANFTFAGVTVTGVSNLGSISNIIIAGGTNGYVLSTNGAGNLSWIPVGNYNTIVSGNSNVNIPSVNGNVTIGINGVSNTAVFSETGANFTGTFNVTGNATFANVSGGNIVTANFVQGTLTTASQPNITSVGTLGSLSITGNLVAGNANFTSNLTVAGVSDLGPVGNVIITGGSNGQVLTTNGSGNLTWTSVGSGSNISNGTSNINIPVANGNINFSANGNANILVITGANAVLNGNIVTGNGTGGNITGANIISANTLNANSVTANFVQGTLTTAAQPNITSVGTLGSLSVTSNIAAGSYVTAPNIIISTSLSVTGTSNLGPVGNVTITGGSNGQVLTTNGSGGLSWANSGGGGSGTSISNGNSNVNIPTANGNITMSVAGNSNVVIVTDTGINVAGTGNITGNLSVANVTIGVGSGGNLTGANIIEANTFIGVFGNGNSNVSIPAANGNVNISAVGNSNVLVVTGTGINVAGTGNFTGNLNAPNITIGPGIGGNLSNANVISANTGNFATNLISGGDLSVSGNAVISGNLTVDGNLIYVNVTDLSVEDPIIQLQTGPNGAPPSSNSGKDVGVALNYYDTNAKIAWMGWDVSNAEISFGSNVGITSEVVTFTSLANIRAGNAQLGNTATANFVSGTLTTASQPNITSVGILSSLVVGGTSNLGPVSNVVITGGTANYVLSTDGSGNLSWVAQTGGGGSANIAVYDEGVLLTNTVASLDFVGNGVTANATGNAVTVTINGGSGNPLGAVSDTFTGNGVQTTFLLSTTPANINLTTVSYNGELILRSSYSLSGANLIFSEAPANNAEIEVTTLSGTAGISYNYSRSSQNATAGQTVFSVVYVIGYIQVYLNGVLLNSTDYTASNGTTVVLTDPAALNDLLEFITFTTPTPVNTTVATFNSTNLNSNLSITAGYSAVSVGPITIANGVSVSIASGQKWVIL